MAVNFLLIIICSLSLIGSVVQSIIALKIASRSISRSLLHPCLNTGILYLFMCFISFIMLISQWS